MSDYFIYVLIAIIVIVGVWFIFAKVLKNKKPKEVTLKDIPIDLEALIHALGEIFGGTTLINYTYTTAVLSSHR